ncbi:MAG: hypothetical protein NVSMB14_15620 [Isosphaeraceae bacterium]
MSQPPRSGGGSAQAGPAMLGTVSLQPTPRASSSSESPKTGSLELFRALSEVKGQAQFLLYLADQIDDSLQQLADETEPGHAAVLCRLLSMYSAQLETKHQGLGDKIAETCQEVYVTVREHDAL